MPQIHFVSLVMIKLREIDILIIQLDVTVLGSPMCLTHPFSAFNRRKKYVIVLLFHEIIEHTTSMCMHPTSWMYS
jgi:hypothetical protein